MVVPKKAPHVSLVAYDQMGVQSTVPSFGTPDILSISAALILMWPLGTDDIQQYNRTYLYYCRSTCSLLRDLCVGFSVSIIADHYYC